MAQFPDLNQLLNELWGWPDEVIGTIGGASNIVVGTNPLWGISNFLTLFPKFGGVPARLPATLVLDSPDVGLSISGLSVGQLVMGPGIPGGTYILSITPTPTPSVTLTQNATATGTVQVMVFTAPLVPIAILNVYITLASGSLMQRRWQEGWSLGMALYVAHFATLYLRTDGPFCTAKQAAVAGLAQGIKVSKGAGAVNVSLQLTPGLEGWGQWNDTEYGKQFAMMARVVGAGPILFW